MLRSARSRAAAKGLPFNITIDDFTIPETCPALGIELTIGAGPAHRDSAPSLDRVVPSMGYVKGNVVVISSRANRIKNDASAYELRRLADFLENHISNDWMKT
jgi:hypothetical protein